MEPVTPRDVAARSGAGGEAGYSLLELVVSTLVLAVVLMVAARLLLESQWMFLRSASEANNPDVGLALTQIRNDLRASSSVRFPASRWSPTGLDLLGHPAGELRYQTRGDTLERIVFDDGGLELGRRPVLRGIVRWRWRQVGAGLVDIELSHASRRAPRGTNLVAPPNRRPGVVEETSHLLRIALRGAKTGRGW